MVTTENISPQSQETDPIKALFDLASFWATIWGFVALCLWVENRVLTALDIRSGSIQIAVLAASTLVIFLLTAHRVESDPKVRLIVDRVRYIVILAAAVLLGAYLQAMHIDQSYESHLRDGAVLACAEIAACKELATQYANTR
jgi:hypothetical protein